MTFVRIEATSEAIQRFHATEDQLLAPYAMRSGSSRGRRHVEPPHPYRSEYSRDRDRIIHSSSFRRLMYKTQVFIGQPNDHQRTRLTHTLEVAQIARTVARNLRLNEDLTEAVGLAHDLGHPPFGHVGERALDRLMAGHGGFEHNRQGLRLVERLEQRYPSFDGLNLSYEILESIALHSGERNHPELAEFSADSRMLAESQVVDICDSIAYDAHDIDDALRAGLIGFDDLRELAIWRLAEERALARYGRELKGKQLSRAVIRALIDWQVTSLLTESQSRLENIADVEQVRRSQGDVIALESELAGMKRELEAFLLERVYRHDEMMRATQASDVIVRRLFEKLVAQPKLLPEKHCRRIGAESAERVVCDYVAGMTDRFAQRCYRGLFHEPMP